MKLPLYLTLQLLVVARLVNKSVPSAADDVIKPAEAAMSDDDVGGCYVVTIFGLKTADCGKHNARSVPTSLDSDLQVLRFEDNRLTVLGDGEFSSYANLQEIYLARNRLELVEATAFRGLFSLQILDVEANQLSAVPTKALRAVALSLRLLNLKNNPIRRLKADSLSSLTRLEEINFEDCWLEYIHPAAFSGLERLSALNLVNNELRTLDSAMQSTFPSVLRVLRLYRNPWTCDCRLRWLRRWLVSRTSSTAEFTINWDFASNTPTCAAPALIRGVAWRHLTADQFACPSRIIAVSAGGTSGNVSATTWIRAMSGLNATVKCLAAGDPEPIISWSQGDRRLAPPRALVSVRQLATVGDIGEPHIVSELTLVSVTASRDSGDYSCMAENTAGRAEMTFKLIVDDAPLTGTSTTGLWPVDRDAFLGIILGLFAVACIVVVCTVLRLRSISRHRRRLHTKNVYYETANHITASPTSNHRPPTDPQTTPLQTAVDDESKSCSEEQSFIDDSKAAAGSPRHPLLAGYSANCRAESERSEESGRRSKQKHNETTSRRDRTTNSSESRSLLSADDVSELDHRNSVTEDDLRDNEDVSLSDDASDDADDAPTNGDCSTNHRERPYRAVSFGPNMIIDARRRSSSSGREHEESRHHGGVVDEDAVDSDAGVLNCDPDDTTRRRSNVYQRQDNSVMDHVPAINSSPPVSRHPTVNRPGCSVTDSRASTDSAALSLGDSSVLTRACGRRHSGEPALVGNGSVRGAIGSHLLDHVSTPTAASSRCHSSSQSASLERVKTRRRLPVPFNTGLRRPPRPPVLGGTSRRPPRDVILTGNHVTDCTPVSLAELLAPPFGGGSAVALRQSQHSRQTHSDQHRPAQVPPHRSNANCVFDDDSGTDI